MIWVLYQNVLLLRLNWQKIYIVLLGAIDLRVKDEFENFCQNLYLILSNTNNTSQFCSIVIRNFCARCRSRRVGDVNSNAAKELDFLTSTARYTHIIDKPTHFLVVDLFALI